MTLLNAWQKRAYEAEARELERAASVSGEAEPGEPEVIPSVPGTSPLAKVYADPAFKAEYLRELRKELAALTIENGALKNAEPTYRALKADAGHWKHEAEMAREEIKALKAEIEGACALLTKANSGTAETIQLARRLGDGDAMDWISAAKRLGEMLAADGPNGYYQFTPKEWFDWASAQLRLKA